ncbi:hypothetical protein ACHAXR_001836 [Thalassiosira sp. AJA248-18]
MWAARALEQGLPCRREQDEEAGGGGEVGVEAGASGELEEPGRVVAVDRFVRDVEYLKVLTSIPHPPRERFRARSQVFAFYVPGDASGSGFGSAVIDDNQGIFFESGTWAEPWTQQSSNFREADNLVTKMESLVATESMEGREVFVFTDNSVFESTFYKGHSQDKKLSDIIFRLHKATRDGGLILHVIHVAGTRMKSWGVDGLSRGDLLDGMMDGQDPLSFISLAEEGANERSGGHVKEWVNSWWNDWGHIPLVEVGKDQWFELKEVDGARLWMPPPAAMETVMEIFNEDWIAHPWNPHVFVVPRLMTHLWRKSLGKDADVIFNVKVGNHFWGSSQHEPLIVAIVLPTTMFDAILGLVRSYAQKKWY